MILFGIFLAILATLDAQQRVNPRLDKPTGKSNWQVGRPGTTAKAVDTVIENKNVNIIVNVDPKDVAKELWSLIETRLEGKTTRRSMPRTYALDELEKIVRPIIAGPSRRQNPPSAFEVADALDRVTRRTLMDEGRRRDPTIDDEINTREIVARMMLKLKLIMESDEANRTGALLTTNSNDEQIHSRRSMKNGGGKASGNADEYDYGMENQDDNNVRIVLNLRKKAILLGNVIYSDTDP